MKKSLVILIPIFLLLTSCQTFKAGYTDDRHEAGPDYGSVSIYSVPSYQTYSGDQFTVGENDPKAVITFTGYSTSQSNIQDIEKLNSYVSLETEEFFSTVEEPLNVGTDRDEGLFIGANSTYVDGQITLAFKKEIKHIEILAVPYSFLTYAFNSEELKIDKDTGISVNDSPYIMLTTTQNDDGSVKETLCRYDNYAKENKDKITIKVGHRRAFIRKITLYY